MIALPWISRSGLMADLDEEPGETAQVYEKLSSGWLSWSAAGSKKRDPTLPVVLTAHCSVQGAVYGGERMVMLGGDLVLSPAMVKDPRLDYVALGHIHKPQNLNEGRTRR